MSKINIIDYYEKKFIKRDKILKRNKYYYSQLKNYFRYHIPEGSRVLEIGCSSGDILAAVNPDYGLGLDFSSKIIQAAKDKFPKLNFKVQDAVDLKIQEKFDYVIISDVISNVSNVQDVFYGLKSVVHNKTRLIISHRSVIWEPLFRLGQKLGLKIKPPYENWLTINDIKNLLELEDFEMISFEKKLLFPKKIPLFDFIFNRILANLPLINKLCLVTIIIARSTRFVKKDYSTSIIIPAKNEMGNIENAVKRIPDFGTSQEIIFVEGKSQDNTYEEMLRVQKKYNKSNISILKQTGIGKGNAVRDGFDKATGDILMILDADLTVHPEELVKFYRALRDNKGDFINGCRLIYPLEKESMKFLNLLGNKFFSFVFSYLLAQDIKDTLCGTKVLYREDYKKIKKNRGYFGDFDPFGDFDLLFGSSKLSLKIIEMPVRYYEREYGSTQINRFSHGWLLLKMSVFAAKKMKFR